MLKASINADNIKSYLADAVTKVASFLPERNPISSVHVNKNNLNLQEVTALLHQHNLSGLLPYRHYDPDSNIFYNNRSIAFMLMLRPIDGAPEDTVNILHGLLADVIPDHADIQFLLVASDKLSPLLDAFEQTRSQRSGLYAWLAKKRAAYLKQGAFQPLSSQSNTILRDFRLYLTVSFPLSKIDSGDLITVRENVMSTLRSIEIDNANISINKFLSQLSDLVSPIHTSVAQPKEWDQLTTLDLQITDPECFLSVEKGKLLFSRESSVTEVRCLVAKEKPEHPVQWKMNDNIGQMFNTALQIPCPFVICMNIRTLSRDSSLSRYQIKSLSKDRDANSPLIKLFPFLGYEYQDAKYMFNRIKEGGKAVKYHYQVVLYAQPEKANQAEQSIKDLYSANGWKLSKPLGFQLPCWLMLLPMATSEGLFEEMQGMGYLQEATAFNAVNMAPFQGEWKGTVTPSTLLIGRRGQVSYWNPFDNTQGNYNMCIVAKSGSGKSVFAQEYMVSMLSQGGRIWVIDAGRSYEKTCRLLGGTFLAFSPELDININPFSTVINLEESMAMLVPLLASMARPSGQISDEELRHLEIAIKSAWQIHNNNTTITYIRDWLAEQESPLANNLALLLFPYTKEGSYTRYFEGKSNIDLNNDLVVLELDDLKNKKDLQRIVLMVLIYHITQAMYLSDRKQRKNCILEELWDMFSGTHNQLAGRFIEEGVRTARRFGAGFIGISQLFSDFHQNNMTQAMYDNSDFKIILAQEHESIEQAKEKKYLHMNGYTEHVLKSLRTVNGEYSEFAIKGPHGLTVHRLFLDPYSSLLYSSKAEEFQFIRDLEAEGTPLIEALEIAARKFRKCGTEE